tara:strand:- start:31817 stop:32401 length:585 start_codon:yes stop_codon:yes gene_type:complete
MTGKGHLFSGIALSLATYTFTNDINGIGYIAAIGTILGAKAPDYLEIRTKVKDENKKVIGTRTLITHRTITHWLPLWLIAGLFLLIQFEQSYFPFFSNYNFNNNEVSNYIFSFFLGYVIGGLLHLITDLPNPMGIPIIHPKKRFSLNLWKSGKLEFLIVLGILLFSLEYSNLIQFNWLEAKKLFVNIFSNQINV